MTKFTNRIKPDSTELERYFLSVYTGNLWDALEKIKDWHSPEHIEKEVQMKLLKLQQQSLPVVPGFVAEWIEILKTKGLKPLKNPETYEETGFTEETLQNIVFWISEHQEDYMRAWLDGYTVEKPQLFKLIFPNSTTVLQKDGELNSFADTVYKRYLIGNAMTEQEIKSIDERYWQFAMPVEDGE